MSSASGKGGGNKKFKSQNKMKFSNGKHSRFSSSAHNYKGIAKLGFKGDFNKWKEELKSFVETDLPLLRSMFNHEPLDVTSGSLPIQRDTLYWIPGASSSLGFLAELDEKTRSKWIELKNAFVKYLRTDYLEEDDGGVMPDGVSGDILNRTSYSVEFEIDGTDYCYDNYLATLQDKELESMISKRAMITVDIQSARTQLQGHILKALQDELRDKILVESEYILDIKEKIDPLKLIKLVESVSADTIRTDDNKRNKDLNEQFYALKQNELSLVDYFNKFNEVLVKMKTYLEPNEIPSEKK
jgi:hypothetical protein